MPELPEAEVVAAQLRERLLGAVLKDCWIGRADIIRQGLPVVDWYRGACLTAIERWGKSIVLTFARGQEVRYFVAELGMTGLLLFQVPQEKYHKHMHVIMTFEGGHEDHLRYWNPRRFGRIYLLNPPELNGFLTRRFGHDPLKMTWDQFRGLVKGRRGRVKALLMHQQRIAGIGNIYATEILFGARVHPHRISNRLRQHTIRRLYDTMRTILVGAVAEGGSSVRDFLAPNGVKGQYQRHHQAYDKAGQPCPAGCGKTIRRLKGERSSFYCPRCQPR